MKLALLAARLPPAHDGVGDHADMLARALAAAGHDVVTIAAGEATPPTGYVLEVTGGSWGAAATARAISALRTHRPDAVIVEYTPFLYGPRSQTPLAVLLAARAMRIRSVAIVHEAFHTHAERSRVGRIKTGYLAARDAVTLSSADVIAVPSAARAAVVSARLPAYTDRVTVVPIGANVEPPAGYRREAATPSTVVAFGVVMPRRRLERAVDAIAALAAAGDDVRLDVIGRTYDATYAQQIVRLAAERGVSDRVRFRGELAPAQISEALRTATAAVHAAREGSIASSGSLLALLAHGVPTVALRTPDDDPVFGSALRYADDDAELAGALRTLAAEPRAAEHLSQAATATYGATFAWAAVAERLRHALQIGATDERLAAA
jgi:glycosyltransferase involved in cell wall biosynthesis